MREVKLNVKATRVAIDDHTNTPIKLIGLWVNTKTAAVAAALSSGMYCLNKLHFKVEDGSLHVASFSIGGVIHQDVEAGEATISDSNEKDWTFVPFED